MTHRDWPQPLVPYRTHIERTKRPVIRLSTKKTRTGITESKFAGLPYWPKQMAYPHDQNGKPMKLLAQLNFAEIPPLEPFPTEGILQFFISAEDDVMGLDFDDPTNQANFKIVYHPKIVDDASLSMSDFSAIEPLNTDYFPIEQELSLSFHLDYEPVSLADWRIDKLLDPSVDLSQTVLEDGEEKELCDVYEEHFSGAGHKIGGYPFFTQADPREYEEAYQDYEILLLQIDSDDDMGIMWGDCGVANFFIKEDDLKSLNFSRVIYNWDCY